MKPLTLLAGLVLAAIALPAAAAQPKLIGTYTDWDAFSLGHGSTGECYVVTIPKSFKPADASHGNVYIMVSIKPANNVAGEFSLAVGYDLKPGSDVTLTSGGFREVLFVSGREAWAYDAKGDARIVAAMKNGQTLSAKAISSRGNNTSYEFSLAGFSNAFSAASGACGR
ncbi:MAG: hypothetical protein GC201_01710 [Alphaproteobacteria bacterium]|nr:hypothetical protein [Alphaproteobacteria bacterium]